MLHQTKCWLPLVPSAGIGWSRGPRRPQRRRSGSSRRHGGASPSARTSRSAWRTSRPTPASRCRRCTHGSERRTSCSSPPGSAAIGPEGARRDSAPVGDVRAAVRLLYDSYELQGDAVLRLLAAEDRIPAVHEMADAGRAWHRDWVERTFAPLLAGLRGRRARAPAGRADRCDRPAGLEAAASRDGARSRDGRADRDRDDHRNERGALMARLLAYHSSSSGNMFPAIDMLLELRRRGHEVHVRTRGSDVEQMEALGLRAAAIDPRIEQIEFDDWRGRSQVDSFLRMVRAYAALRAARDPRPAAGDRRGQPGRPDRRHQLLRARCTSPRRRDCRGRSTAPTRRRSAPLTFLRTGSDSVPRADRWGGPVTASGGGWAIDCWPGSCRRSTSSEPVSA